MWLMSLALLLGVTLVIAIPAIITAESVRPSDWIGFSGSVVGGAITLFAAIIAWFAVGRQVEQQREAAENHRADAIDEKLQRHAVTIFDLQSKFEKVIYAKQAEDLYTAFQNLDEGSASWEVLSLLTDFSLGDDQPWASELVGMYREVALAYRTGGVTKEIEDKAKVATLLQAELMNAIGRRRKYMRVHGSQALQSMPVDIETYRVAIRKSDAGQ